MLCFLKHPRSLIEDLGERLSSGATIAFNDYYALDYEMVPGAAVFDRVIHAIRESWSVSGGDLSVQKKVPGWLESSGFRIQSLKRLVEVARPNNSFWYWPETFFRVFLPKLVEMKLLQANDLPEFWEFWGEVSQKSDSFFMTPTMLDVIAVKV